MNRKIVLTILSGAGVVVQQLVLREIKKRQAEFVQQTLSNVADQLFDFNKTIKNEHPETKPNDRATERAFKDIISNY